MQLYFVRHATASSKADWTTSDDLRPLTRSGRHRFADAAAALVAAGALHPDLIITSPLVRAVQTAELLAEALPGSVEIVEDARLGHSFDLAALSAIIAEHADLRSLAIVGHNPSFAETLSAFTGGSGIDVRKGAIALVEVDAAETSHGRLLWLAPPSLFVAEPRA